VRSRRSRNSRNLAKGEPLRGLAPALAESALAFPEQAPAVLEPAPRQTAPGPPGTGARGIGPAPTFPEAAGSFPEPGLLEPGREPELAPRAGPGTPGTTPDTPWAPRNLQREGSQNRGVRGTHPGHHRARSSPTGTGPRACDRTENFGSSPGTPDNGPSLLQLVRELACTEFSKPAPGLTEVLPPGDLRPRRSRNQSKSPGTGQGPWSRPQDPGTSHKQPRNPPERPRSSQNRPQSKPARVPPSRSSAPGGLGLLPGASPGIPSTGPRPRRTGTGVPGTGPGSRNRRNLPGQALAAPGRFGGSREVLDLPEAAPDSGGRGFRAGAGAPGIGSSTPGRGPGNPGANPGTLGTGPRGSLRRPRKSLNLSPGCRRQSHGSQGRPPRSSRNRPRRSRNRSGGSWSGARSSRNRFRFGSRPGALRTKPETPTSATKCPGVRPPKLSRAPRAAHTSQRTKVA
jgi:hypothetical protein